MTAPSPACKMVLIRTPAHLAFYAILGLGGGDGLPLKVGYSIRPAGAKRLYVINHIANATLSGLSSSRAGNRLAKVG